MVALTLGRQQVREEAELRWAGVSQIRKLAKRGKRGRLEMIAQRGRADVGTRGERDDGLLACGKGGGGGRVDHVGVGVLVPYN